MSLCLKWEGDSLLRLRSINIVLGTKTFDKMNTQINPDVKFGSGSIRVCVSRSQLVM